MNKLHAMNLKALLFRVFLLTVLSMFYLNGYAQKYRDPYVEFNFVPNLIKENHSWGYILDTLIKKYPDKDNDIARVRESIEILSSPADRDSIENLFLKILEPYIDWHLYIEDRKRFMSYGRSAIPVLIKYINSNAATRLLGTDENDISYYYCLCDIAVKRIEEITDIDFFRYKSLVPYQCSRDHGNDARYKKTLSEWYNRTEGLDKAKAIKGYLEYCLNENCQGDIYRTARNLALAGDTVSSIKYLTHYYETTGPLFSPNLIVARIVSELGGGEIAKEDCLAYLRSHKGGGRLLRGCIGYLSHRVPISSEICSAFADVLHAHKQSFIDEDGKEFIWYDIYSYANHVNSQLIKPILIRMLELKVVAKDQNSPVRMLSRKYPQAYEEGYRICDLALLRLTDLFPNEISVKDWSDINERDQVISNLLEQYDLGE